MPNFGFMGGIHNYTGTEGSGRPAAGAGYGKTLKDDYRRFYGATVGFSGRGEMIPNEDSYCELDPTVVDRWGIPVLRFHFQWSDYEINQAKHMQETFRAIITEMGGTPMNTMPSREEGYGIAPENVSGVFERFRRPGADPSVRGMGLGLYLSRHLMRAMHGSISAASPGVGKGATFTIVLPIAAD